MLKKISILLIIFLCTMGICAAKEVTDFTVPAEFSENTYDGVYTVPGATDNPSFIILKTLSIYNDLQCFHFLCSK